MAFMNQERKATIAAELKKVMPVDWKYSLSVKHYSTIVLTISAAPIDLLQIVNSRSEYKAVGYTQLNPYGIDHTFSGELLDTFKSIKKVLNTGNHDNSDPMTDYFDVGWYVNINIGRWDKHFQVIAKKQEPSLEQLKARLASLEAQLSTAS